PISRRGPNRSTPMPFSAARAAPAATSAGPRSAPPASTATVTTACGLRELVAPARGDDFAPLVAAAHWADAVREPGAVACGARVIRGRADLVLSAPLRGAGVGLLLLGDGHGRRRLAGSGSGPGPDGASRFSIMQVMRTSTRNVVAGAWAALDGDQRGLEDLRVRDDRRILPSPLPV